MNINRNATVIVAWLAYLGVIVYLANIMDAVAIPFAAIMMVPLIVMMNFLWGKNSEDDIASASMTEKRKRERIDTMLRDMSDDDLFALRQRLQDGDIDEGSLYDSVVGDDGELVIR